MKLDIQVDNYLNSITGLTATTAALLLLTRKFDLAALFFAALSLGSVGVAWDRYSTKSGSPLDIRALKKGRKLDESEINFIVTHLPYAGMALLSLLAHAKLRK